MSTKKQKKIDGRSRCREKILSGILVLLLGVTGCGRADRSQIEADISKVNAGMETASDEDPSGNMLGEIPEHIAYEKINDSNGNCIKVDAAVIVPEIPSYGVYKENHIDINDAYLKTMAEKLFDRGEYEQIKPAWMCTQEELEKEQEYINRLVSTYDLDALAINYGGAKEDIAEVCLPDWLYYLYHYYNEVSYDGSTEAELTEGKLIYGYEDFYDAYDKEASREYNTCALRGTVDGREWILYYENVVNDGVWLAKVVEGPASSSRGSIVSFMKGCNQNMLVLAPVDSRSVGGIEICSQDNYLETNLYGENASDEEQCRRMVYDFAEEMGLADSMDIVCVNNCIVTDEEGNRSLDGYRMYMAPVIDGVQNYFSDMACLHIENESYDTNAWQEYIAFDVSSEGVGNVFIGDRYEIGECMSQQAGMLTFEQADMIAQKHMQELVDTSTVGTAYFDTIDRIELVYATVRYDEGYSMIPVWMYYLRYDRAYMFRQAYFGINAVDGSIVNVVYSGDYDYMFQ